MSPATAAPARRRRFLHLPAFFFDYLLALPVGCVVALVWVNGWPESYYRFAQTLDFSVNNVGIVFFFALITKEVIEAALPGGVLHPWRRAALPVVAAFGAVLVPIACYVAYLTAIGEPMLISMWMVPCGVDIAASYLVARLIFGRHPALPFLILLAISANAIGMACLAVLRPIGDANLALGLGLMAAALVLAGALRLRRVKSFWPYLIGPGALSWWALFLAGVHPALALVPIMPFLPHAARDAGLFVDPAPRARDALTKFERWWLLPVQGVLFLSGLVNAGVPLHGLEAGMWAIPIATLIGRPLGVVMAAWLALAVGLRLPHRIGWRALLVIGSTASIGLAMTLFFAAASVPLGPLLSELKMGALLTVGGAGLAFAAARVLRVGRFAR